MTLMSLYFNENEKIDDVLVIFGCFSVLVHMIYNAPIFCGKFYESKSSGNDPNFLEQAQ